MNPSRYPEDIVTAGLGEIAPDRRVLKMLGARGSHVAADGDIDGEGPGRRRTEGAPA